MGLWDWLGRVLGGHQKARRPAPPPAGSSGRPQPSPPPGDKLGAISNQQITSWDPGGVSYGTATTRVTPNQQQGGPSISPPALPPVPARRDGSRAAPPPPPRPKPPAGLEALDASQFAPMTSDDVRAFIKDMGSAAWRNAFLNGGWGRGMIPAPSITRIQLIDRAMVGLGFITPEELVQIHEVGLQMDKARGDLRLAAEAANRAVIQSEEERKALKERKKAEAAERRRLHAEQVAHRRATDIVFLGRGVSGGLADRRSNVEKLQAEDVDAYVPLTDNDKIPTTSWLTRDVEFRLPRDLQLQVVGEKPTVSFRLDARAAQP